MKRARSVAVLLLVTSVLAGCLFPSFDDLGTGQPATGTPGANRSDGGSNDDGAPGSKPGESAPPNGTGTSPDGSSSPSDGGTKSAPVYKPEFACGAGTCNGALEHCCFTLGGPDCQEHQYESQCQNQAGSGDVVKCDGAEDCKGAGEVCCFLAGEKKAACRTSCGGGKVLCSGSSNHCNVGQCTGSVTIGSPGGTNYQYCQ